MRPAEISLISEIGGVVLVFSLLRVPAGNPSRSHVRCVPRRWCMNFYFKM